MRQTMKIPRSNYTPAPRDRTLSAENIDNPTSNITSNNAEMIVERIQPRKMTIKDRVIQNNFDNI